MPRNTFVGLVAGLLVAAPAVWAQQSSPPAAPRHDAPSPADLEPGVNTSAMPPIEAPTSSAESNPGASSTSSGTSPSTEVEGNTSSTKPSSRAKSSHGRAKGAPASDAQSAGAGATPNNAESSTAAGERPSNAKPTSASGAPRGGKAEDHLQLDTTQITGNQELPKVLYIVPWKRSDLGDLLGKPANSLLDEVLEPVDRDVFRRENRYYDALKPDGAQAATGGGGAAGQSSSDKR